MSQSQKSNQPEDSIVGQGFCDKYKSISPFNLLTNLSIPDQHHPVGFPCTESPDLTLSISS